MKGTVNQFDRTDVVSYQGDSTGLLPGALSEVITLINSGAHAVLIDMSRLSSLNRTAIRAIFDSIKLAASRNINFAILSPNREVRRVLKLNGLDSGIPIFSNLDKALSELEYLDYKYRQDNDNADTLLIVRGNLNIGRFIHNGLKAHHLQPCYHLKLVRGLDEAYSYIQEVKIDCILLDAGLPMMHFEKFVERVQSNNRLPEIPILVVATDKTISAADMMIRHGAHDMIRYPFKPEEICSRLQILISYLKDDREFVPLAGIPVPRGYKA
jgi:anti-anti-sigma factor